MEVLKAKGTGQDIGWLEVLKIQKPNQNPLSAIAAKTSDCTYASSYSGMQFIPFKTQNGRLAVWPQAQTHRNATKLATDYER